MSTTYDYSDARETTSYQDTTFVSESITRDESIFQKGKSASRESASAPPALPRTLQTSPAVSRRYRGGQFPSLSPTEGMSSFYSETLSPSDDYSDELSSTALYSPSDRSSDLSQLLFENRVLRAVKGFFARLQKPLVFGAVVASGNKFGRGLLRMANFVQLTHEVGAEFFSEHFPGELVEEGVAEVLPAPPQWMSDMRSSSAVLWLEKPVSWVLRRWKVLPRAEGSGDVISPALSAVERGVQALKASAADDGEVLVSSGTMIPTVVIIPILTLIVLYAARVVSDRRLAVMNLDGEEDIEDDEAEQQALERELRELSPVLQVANRWASPGGTERSMLGSVPKADLQPLPPKPSGHMHLESVTVSDTTEMAETPFKRALSPMQLTNKDSGQVMPSKIVSTPVSSRQFSEGSVVVALAGSPTVAEVNRVLVASVRFGCAKILLPIEAKAMDHIAVPPSAAVEYTSSVLDAVPEVANRRGMRVISVFARAVVDDAVNLVHFSHPAMCIYLFSSAQGLSVEEVTQISDTCLYVYEQGPADLIPINECFTHRTNEAISSPS